MHWHLKGIMDPVFRSHVPSAAWAEAATAALAHAGRSRYLATSLRKVRPAQTRRRSSNTHLRAHRDLRIVVCGQARCPDAASDDATVKHVTVAHPV